MGERKKKRHMSCFLAGSHALKTQLNSHYKSWQTKNPGHQFRVQSHKADNISHGLGPLGCRNLEASCPSEGFGLGSQRVQKL